MKQLSILLLILMYTQTAYSRTLTRLIQAAHSTRRSLHIPPKIHSITIHPKYNIKEQDEATQIRAAILAENREYKEALDDIRYNLIKAYQEDNNIYTAENMALFNIEMLTTAHYARIKELHARLKKAEAKTSKKR